MAYLIVELLLLLLLLHLLLDLLSRQKGRIAQAVAGLKFYAGKTKLEFQRETESFEGVL